MGILIHGTLQKLNMATQILELLNEQHRMNVIACQSVWLLPMAMSELLSDHQKICNTNQLQLKKGYLET